MRSVSKVTARNALPQRRPLHAGAVAGGGLAVAHSGWVDRAAELGTTLHVAQHVNGRCSAIDGRTARHLGDTVCRGIRKRIKEVFGWG